MSELQHTAKQLRVVAVEAIPIQLSLSQPNNTAMGVVTETTKVIVKITTDTGISGFGEASTFPAYGGGTADAVMSAVAACSPYLRGANPLNYIQISAVLGEIIAREQLALAAIDVALQDIAGKSLGQPIYELYGNNVRESVEVFLIVSGEDPAEVAENARQAKADGFKVVKVKAGFETIEMTIAKIEAIRREVGLGLDITVDANQAWQVDEAIANIKLLEPLSIQSIEQPVLAKDIQGMADVTNATGVQIIADESVWDMEDALQVIKIRGADVLSIRVSKAGGIYNARLILKMARDAGIPCILGSMLETDLGISAALQLAGSVDCKLYASALSHYLMYEASLLEKPLRRKGSTLHIPNEPGLGVTVCEEKIDLHRC